MIKAVPYIQTLGRETFKKFVQTPFTLDMLFPVFGDKSTQLLFEGWRGKDMMKWYKFIHDDGAVLEFYPNKFVLKKTGKDVGYELLLPSTINDFINITYQYGIELYWTSWVNENFEPKEYLHVEQIKSYFEDLLGRMGKSHELL